MLELSRELSSVQFKKLYVTLLNCQKNCRDAFWLTHFSISKILRFRQYENISCFPSLHALLLNRTSNKSYFIFCWNWCIWHSKWSFSDEGRFIWPYTLIDISFYPILESIYITANFILLHVQKVKFLRTTPYFIDDKKYDQSHTRASLFNFSCDMKQEYFLCGLYYIFYLPS